MKQLLSGRSLRAASLQLTCAKFRAALGFEFQTSSGYGPIEFDLRRIVAE